MEKEDNKNHPQGGQWGQGGQGGHSETVLILGLFDQSTPSWIKVRGWGGWWPM